MTHSAHQRRGFTLMEIALVLAVIVAVAALAAPAYQGTLKRERLRKAADSIAADWVRTRAAAIESGQTQLWVCTLATGTYSAAAYSPTSVTNGEVANMVGADPAATGDPDDTFGSAMPDGVSITGAMVSDADTLITMGMTTTTGESGSATLLFYPNGTSSSGRIVVQGEDERALAVVLNGVAGTVRVVPVESDQ